MPDIFFLHTSGRQPQSEHRIFIYNKLRTQTNKTFFRKKRLRSALMISYHTSELLNHL
jgi:hypothetical protein